MGIFGPACLYLVDPTQRRHVHGLSPDSTGTADTGGVLTRSTVDDGVHQNLKGVLKEGTSCIRLPTTLVKNLKPLCLLKEKNKPESDIKSKPVLNFKKKNDIYMPKLKLTLAQLYAP